MTARANVRAADLDRALKLAAKRGYQLVVDGSRMIFLPIDPKAPLPSPDQGDAEAAWDRALGLGS